MDKDVLIYIHRQTQTHTCTTIIQVLKEKILPFATVWMDLEGIMLGEISQTGEGWGEWELGEGGSKAQTFSYKVNKY